jgi:hypothetical protein
MGFLPTPERQYALFVSGRQVIACVVLVTSWSMLVLHDQGVFEGAPRGNVSDVAMLIAVVLALGVGVYVGRWAVVSLAATPVVVLGLLQATGYQEPFHEPQPPLYGWPWWIAFCAVPLALGVLVQRGALVPWRRSPRSL